MHLSQKHEKPIRALLLVAALILLPTQAKVFGEDEHSMLAHAGNDVNENVPSKKSHESSAELAFDIKAPREYVWKMLTDFQSYPQVFKRIKSCKVTKQDGDYVYTESFLKPQMFLREPCQHAVNDLTGKPEQLRWKLLDGNFKSVSGVWTLKQTADSERCSLSYKLTVDPGPFIPQTFASMMLKIMQREAITSVKARAESAYKEQHVHAGETANSKV